MEKIQPPDLPFRILRRFCPDRLLESIEGDLVEQFETDTRLLGKRKATRLLYFNVLKFFRPGILLRNKISFTLTDIIMLRSYLTVAFRNIARNKVFSAINIFGLGAGLATCLLIFQFVTFELSYDRFNDKVDRIYRITNDRFQNGKLIQHGTIMYPTIGPTMARDFPEIETYTRMMPEGDMNVKAEDRLFRGDQCHFVDEHFLSVFSFPLLAGDKASALKDPLTIAITETTAKKFFNVTAANANDALGKVVYWGQDTRPYKVTAVLKDIPENSHIRFDILVSYSTLISADNHGADDSWTWSDMRHYLVLRPGADPKALERKFPAYSERYFKGDKVSGSVEKFYLQPLKDAHLYSDYEYDIAKRSSGKAVWAMLIVAVFILIIAWINYINLTTARALDRAREVGMRKVMGALRSQLMRQFIFESVIISLIALAGALVFARFFQSSFNEMTGNNLSLAAVLKYATTPTLLLLAAVLVAGIFLSGFYPAFILSGYQPSTVLKGKFQRSSRGQFLKKFLVVFQFMASAALITGTIIVAQQLKFMNSTDLGINIKNTLIISSPENTPWDSTYIQRVESYKHALLQIPGVISAATSSRLPGQRLGRSFGVRLTEQDASSKHTMSFVGADHDFLNTYDVPLLAGRKFLLSDHHADFKMIHSVILNNNAIRLLGIASPESALGKEVADGNNRWTIIGVVSDFHQESLKTPMEPMLFLPLYSTNGRTSVKLAAGDQKAQLIAVEKVYREFFPGNAFEYDFMEDRYRNQYRDDERFGKVITIFTVLAIIISCLGLIGLSSYTAQQRTKEIGIRKVLGAQVSGIVGLLSFDFIRLVLVACLLSMPIAYFGMQNWLQGYAYRIPISIPLMILPVLVILAVAAFTISFQVFKTARTNPADTLRHSD